MNKMTKEEIMKELEFCKQYINSTSELNVYLEEKIDLSSAWQRTMELMQRLEEMK